MEKVEFQLPEASQIEEWKAKHKEVFKIEVEDKEGKKYHAFVRNAKLREIQIASASEKKKAGSFLESIYANTKLAAHPAIDQDDYLKMGVLSKMDEIIEMGEATIKKL